MKHAIIILTLVVLALGLSDRSAEVRDRAFVQTLTIGQSENISVNVTLFGSDVAYLGIGEDLATALDDAQLKQGKTLFTGHTELVAFQEGGFSFETLETLLQDGIVSPNCPVILLNETLTETQLENALDVLKSYDRLDKISMLTVSEVVKGLKSDVGVKVPYLNDSLTYSTRWVYSV